jgi:hypothetical protein
LLTRETSGMFDNVNDEKSTFTGFKTQNIALGTGLG